MSNDYHGRIMNLQIDPENVLDGWTRREFGAYKDGHRDARHNAAALGNEADIELHAARSRGAEADARIAELEAAMEAMRGAMPDADTLDRAACKIDQFAPGGAIAMHCLQDAAARIRALATATDVGAGERAK